MKKIFIFLAWIFGLSGMASGAWADTSVSFNPPGKGGSFEAMASGIFNVFLGSLGIVALLAFIWAGFTWMISNGDSGKIAKAKKIMIWAVAGLVVIFTSYAILTLLFNAFGYATPGKVG